MDPAPPLSVRWFYATDSPKVDHSPFKLGAVDPPILIPPIGASKSKSPTAWTAFSRRDSARIEEAHQALLLDKTAAATVLVNEDYLYEVDVTKREICPGTYVVIKELDHVYWYGPIFDIRRGTWFSSTDNSMAKIVPCDDNLSKQLEDGYKKFKPWLREFAEPNAIPSQSSPGSASAITAASPLSQPAVLTHLSSSDTKPADPSLSSNESLKTASPATTPVFKPEQKWALFGPYMNSHVLYTDKQSAHIISDNVGAKVARAFMSTVTRTPDNPVAWGTKVWRGWDEVEKAMRKAPAQKLDKKRASAGNLEAMYTSTAGGESTDSVNVAAAVGGGSEGNLSSKKSTEKLNQLPLPADGTAEEESGQDRQINHLVLVIHGVGQKLGERVETVDFAKDCTTLRQALKSSSKQYFTAGAPTVSSSTRDPATTQSPPPASSWKKPVIADMPDMGGVQVLPVQWRQKIDFGKRKDPNSKSGSGANGKLTQEEEEELKAEIEAMREKEVHLDDITLDGVQSIRYLVSDIVLDVLLYMTPKYRQQMVNHVIEEMNRIYTAYLERNPTFNGKISVYGHSLGSLLAFDILCHQAHGDTEVSVLKPNGFADSRHTMSELDLSDVMNRATMADKTERRLNGLMERAEIQYNTLQFKVDKFFAVGSPVGLFLLLKGNKLAGRVGNEPIQRGISAPACNAIYNVFHPHDPVAYRFEPLACKPLAKEKPVPIQYNKGGLRGTVTAISDLSSGLVSRGFNMFSGLFVGGASGSAAAVATAAATVGSVPGTPTGGLSTPGSPQKTDGSMSDRKSSNEKLKEKESSDSKEKRKGVDLDMENVRRLNPRGRLDYVMQEGVLENPYLSSLRRDLSMKQVYDFYDQKTPDDAIKFLGASFENPDGLDGTSSDKRAILLDFYYYVLSFAKEHRFPPEKASAFFSIMKATHVHVTESPFPRFDSDYAFFKDLLLKHCINRPPFSQQVFTFSEMKQISEYATNTYFRHYLMYKYAFTKQIKLEFKISNAYCTPTPSLERLNGGAVEYGLEISVDAPDGDAMNAVSEQLVPSAEQTSTDPDSMNSQAQVLTDTATAAPEEEPTATAAASQLQNSEEEPKEEKTLEQSKHDIASEELKNFVMSTLAPRLDEMKAALLAKLSNQESELNARIKKLEGEEEKALAVQNDKGKKEPAKPKAKK
ncbi:hypothetical protein HDU77_001635 [Chytriomyces hyalinus]|nr:hypothetical protein HDU77_001635 [Chytriomyces hyalinus]